MDELLDEDFIQHDISAFEQPEVLDWLSRLHVLFFIMGLFFGGLGLYAAIRFFAVFYSLNNNDYLGFIGPLLVILAFAILSYHISRSALRLRYYVQSKNGNDLKDALRYLYNFWQLLVALPILIVAFGGI